MGPKAIEAKIVTLEEVVLTDPTEVADHNLKKLRTALNMITGQISEANKPEQGEGMKVWHKLVQEKFAKITLDESKASLPMKNRIKAVRSGIEICSEVYEDEGTSGREKGMKQQEAMTKYQVVSKQAQNRKHQKSKAASANQWLSSKASRSTLQTKSKQADYAEDDFEIVENTKK